MNSVIEKEEKLTLALTKLKNLNLKNPDLQNSVENLSSKKNQLEKILIQLSLKQYGPI